MLREYHKWHSPILNREMELLVFGHAGAKVIIFPTSTGRFFDWENRGMINTLQRHIDNGWIQVFCVDSVDTESWYNHGVDATTRAARHLQYQDYIVNEVLPFARSKNDNPYTIAAGASFGGYHSVSIALRYPEAFNRVIGMSGLYDVRRWTNGDYNDLIHQANPQEYVRCLDDQPKLERIRQIDWIIPIGHEDPCFDTNQGISEAMWSKGVWHAFRIWDGNAHDWPYWQDMILTYIGGADSRG